MYDNPVIYEKDLSFKEEINSFEQVKNSANFAKAFANETDTTLNDMTNTLTTFKTKLLDAANDTNNVSNRQAIAKELEAELTHLKDLANTSINGKYIFTGSTFNKKPIDDNFKYQGNDKKIKAFLGAGVERVYNIDGKSLFLGRDNDYKKHTTLNVIQYDKMKANPQFVVRGKDGKLYIDKNNSEDSIAVNENIQPQKAMLNPSAVSTTPLRVLTGITDFKNSDGTYTSGNNYFFIKGKKSDGSVIDTSFTLSNDDSIQKLLDKIGEIYGNTSTSKNVDVSLNNDGEIQIKDLNSGKMLTDFYMVAGGKFSQSQPDPTSIKDLISGGYDIVSFQKSKFDSIRNLDTITASNIDNNKTFKFFSNFKLKDNSKDALPDNLLQNVIGEKAVRSSDGTIQDIAKIHLSRTDTDGNSVSDDLDITSTTTMKDLMDKIKSDYGDVDVYLENGELKIVDNSISNTQKSNLSISLEAEDSNGNALQAFRSEDVANFKELFFEKKSNLNISNYSQIVADYKYEYDDGQLITKQNSNAQHYADFNTVLADTINLSPSSYPQTINIRFRDINGNFNTATVTLRDTPDSDGHLSTFSINGNTYDILDKNGEKTPAHDKITTQTTMNLDTCELCQEKTLQKGVTFKQLSDVVSMIVTNNLPASSTQEDYNKALQNAQKEVSAGIGDKGKFFVKDLNSQPTKMELSMYGDNFSFQENNAITIDEPETDFFGTLQKAIDAVKNGQNYANASSSDPRNFGIQGALEAIEHVMDRVGREDATTGAVSQEFDLTIQRTDMLKNHITVLQSDNIDTDIGKASMQLNSLKLSYQALLASIAKVNNLTLLNYLR